MSSASNGSTRKPPTSTICRVKRPICSCRATALCWSSSERWVTCRYSARCSRCVSRISRRSFWISSLSIPRSSVPCGSHVPAAVDRDGLARHVGRVVGDEEEDSVGDVARDRDAAQRHLVDVLLIDALGRPAALLRLLAAELLHTI